MTKKKKIALLNFPLDNNYGGNLQRFALMYVLQNMGYDVTHLQTRFHWTEYYPSWFKFVKRHIKWTLGKMDADYVPAWVHRYRFEKGMRHIYPFYNHYIKHTPAIYSYDELAKYTEFDVYIVGSDQVWRRSMSGQFPYSSMFFDFVNKQNVKKIAYGVSLGNAEIELKESEWNEIKKLYEKFSMVSVREDSALPIFEQYGWICPTATQVLDPTLLLDRMVYETLVKNTKTKPSKGNIFCYVLDQTPENKSLMLKLIREIGGKPYTISLDGGANSIEQWLRSFMDAEYVITDSYHGMLFSIIFNKPFKLMYNARRGNARFESMLKLMQIRKGDSVFDWDAINKIIKNKREKSIDVLRIALE